MQVPETLNQAIENEIAGCDPELLSRAAAKLSSIYRGSPFPAKPPILSEAYRLAYISVRMPATYAAIRAVLLEVKRRLPETQIRGLLDLGAGPGTAMWAAAGVFAELDQMTLVERDHTLIELGKRLAQGSGHSAMAEAVWLSLDLRHRPELAPHDLVLISYTLGELDEATRRFIISAAWQATEKVLAIIEPGTPRGFSYVLEARDELIALGAHVIAPCPHAASCPMASGDWCHFSQRLERSAFHRRVKAATLPYEDEKFSYFVAAKFPAAELPARIIRHPLKRSGHILLDLCAAEGLQRVTISRKNKEAFKRARKAEWGEAWMG